MKKEVRTVVYDVELRIKAYRFEGIVQPFPNHGFVVAMAGIALISWGGSKLELNPTGDLLALLMLAGLFLSKSRLFLRKEEKQNGLAK